MECACSAGVDVVWGISQNRVFWRFLFLLHISDLPGTFEYVLVGSADDSTLLTEGPGLSDRAFIVASLNCDLLLIDE